ncbi:hypothetical protein N657DRAFT_379642 [Parathielavia appendiculata]|uniref:Uncharacterized protein n=1 Tax=Parathielavia appendiculata TaxID=2587402 RepID=A0AAN6U2T9_9PEZI|nr:hypothetical protein N657DRAFT_379642 [Parathielavia appendiculata]
MFLIIFLFIYMFLFIIYIFLLFSAILLSLFLSSPLHMPLPLFFFVLLPSLLLCLASYIPVLMLSSWLAPGPRTALTNTPGSDCTGCSCTTQGEFAASKPGPGACCSQQPGNLLVALCVSHQQAVLFDAMSTEQITLNGTDRNWRLCRGPVLESHPSSMTSTELALERVENGKVHARPSASIPGAFKDRQYLHKPKTGTMGFAVLSLARISLGVLGDDIIAVPIQAGSKVPQFKAAFY